MLLWLSRQLNRTIHVLLNRLSGNMPFNFNHVKTCYSGLFTIIWWIYIISNKRETIKQKVCYWFVFIRLPFQLCFYRKITAKEPSNTKSEIQLNRKYIFGVYLAVLGWWFHRNRQFIINYYYRIASFLSYSSQSFFF